MALIIADSGEQAREYAQRLLAAATDPAQVRTTYDISDGVVGFDVPDELADVAGFGAAAEDPEPVLAVVANPETEQPAPEPPARNASREKWAAWLDAKEIEYPADAGRDELVALWDSLAE